jgi:hypothetical protein
MAGGEKNIIWLSSRWFYRAVAHLESEKNCLDSGHLRWDDVALLSVQEVHWKERLLNSHFCLV